MGDAQHLTWAQRAARRHWWLMAWGLSHAKRPLPMHRQAAVWSAGRLIEADYRLRVELAAIRRGLGR